MLVRRDSGKIPGERDEKWAKQCSNGVGDSESTLMLPTLRFTLFCSLSICF